MTARRRRIDPRNAPVDGGRRRFIVRGIASAGLFALGRAPAAAPAGRVSGSDARVLFLGGDLMSGRGIDRIQHQWVDPRLYEPYLKDAGDYVRLAGARSGTVPSPVGPAYVWGVALDVLDGSAADVRIVNLETAVTARGEPWPGKGIHYRMHPANVALLKAAAVDCCVLANNHVLDWGTPGLRDTRQALASVGVQATGAGDDDIDAATPAVMAEGSGWRVLVFGFASTGSGVPPGWAARPGRPGVNLIDEQHPDAADLILQNVDAHRRPGDLVVVSLHWGGNWGCVVPRHQIALAHRLIDSGLVNIVHGHSSHHPKAIEAYRDGLVLYGCGDLINDYEGIRRYQAYRGDLRLLYFPRVDRASGRLLDLEIVPLQSRRLRLEHVSRVDGDWLLQRLNRDSARFGTVFAVGGDGRFRLV